MRTVKPKQQPKGLSIEARRDLVRGILASVAFVVLSLALLLWANPVARWQIVQGIVAPRAAAPLQLVVAHTNDTWGYTQACG